MHISCLQNICFFSFQRKDDHMLIFLPMLSGRLEERFRRLMKREKQERMLWRHFSCQFCLVLTSCDNFFSMLLLLLFNVLQSDENKTKDILSTYSYLYFPTRLDQKEIVVFRVIFGTDHQLSNGKIQKYEIICGGIVPRIILTKGMLRK